MSVTELLRDTGRATATVITYLSALKGVAKEAWMLRLMDLESFQHIRAVRNLRGSRLPRGRALPPAEIRALFGACEADDSSIGGDAGRYSRLRSASIGGRGAGFA